MQFFFTLLVCLIFFFLGCLSLPRSPITILFPKGKIVSDIPEGTTESSIEAYYSPLPYEEAVKMFNELLALKENNDGGATDNKEQSFCQTLYEYLSENSIDLYMIRPLKSLDLQSLPSSPFFFDPHIPGEFYCSFPKPENEQDFDLFAKTSIAHECAINIQYFRTDVSNISSYKDFHDCIVGPFRMSWTEYREREESSKKSSSNLNAAAAAGVWKPIISFQKLKDNFDDLRDLLQKFQGTEIDGNRKVDLRTLIFLDESGMLSKDLTLRIMIPGLFKVNIKDLIEQLDELEREHFAFLKGQTGNKAQEESKMQNEKSTPMAKKRNGMQDEKLNSKCKKNKKEVQNPNKGSSCSSNNLSQPLTGSVFDFDFTGISNCTSKTTATKNPTIKASSLEINPPPLSTTITFQDQAAAPRPQAVQSEIYPKFTYYPLVSAPAANKPLIGGDANDASHLLIHNDVNLQSQAQMINMNQIEVDNPPNQIQPPILFDQWLNLDVNQQTNNNGEPIHHLENDQKLNPDYHQLINQNDINPNDINSNDINQNYINQNDINFIDESSIIENGTPHLMEFFNSKFEPNPHELLYYSPPAPIQSSFREPPLMTPQFHVQRSKSLPKSKEQDCQME